MDYSYEYSYTGEEEIAAVFLIIYLIYYLVMIAFGITSYVLTSLGLYSIAKRREITNPWLAWIPVASAWIVGSISDQFRYVTKGQIRNKRKILVILYCVVIVLGIVVGVAMGLSVTQMEALPMDATDAQVFSSIMDFLIWFMVGWLALLGVSITYAVFYYMAMYDVYHSTNPSTSVAFLVLSIFFRVTEPFFVFFNRKKDLGMPLRTNVPVEPVQYLPAQTAVPESWTNDPQF